MITSNVKNVSTSFKTKISEILHQSSDKENIMAGQGLLAMLDSFQKRKDYIKNNKKCKQVVACPDKLAPIAGT